MDDVLCKKMKRASVGLDQFLAVDDGAKAKLKYQTLLNDYLELQKEYVSKKRKLQSAEHKRETIWGEVRFLRRRHIYLSKNQAPKLHEVVLHLPNSSDRESNGPRGKRNQLMFPNSLVNRMDC